MNDPNITNEEIAVLATGNDQEQAAPETKEEEGAEALDLRKALADALAPVYDDFAKLLAKLEEMSVSLKALEKTEEKTDETDRSEPTLPLALPPTPMHDPARDAGGGLSEEQRAKQISAAVKRLLDGDKSLSYSAAWLLAEAEVKKQQLGK